MSERKTIYLCLAHMSEEGWEQKYVKEAFDTNWVVPMGPNVNAFENDLADVFPYLSATNIQRGFNSRGGYVDTNATRRIIKEMVNEFEDVVDVMIIVSKN